MNKLFIFIIPLLIISFYSSDFVLAQEGAGVEGLVEEPELVPTPTVTTLQGGLDSAANQAGLKKDMDENNGQNIAKLIGEIISVFLPFLSLIFLVMAVYAGLRWLTSGGNDQTVSRAKSTLIHASIGLFVTLVAWALTSYILARIGEVVAP